MNSMDNSKTQTNLYSPTPKIKIIKWHKSTCIACIHASKDYGEYDCIGWWECNEYQKLGNLKSFPNCNASSCKKFCPKSVSKHECDYWEMITDFEKYLGGKGAYKKIHNLLDFNQRMGDYEIGRIF
ncbi:hypothetical protein [Poseidonibacter lekithochrous]|uniref:hypothetical protein n=1 Tax=Poseidonibacter lekithochrous TaxID=1904463 RepID=UPI000D348CEE|nr:hypothetical protein [Poseidonibacter lekithochrous]